MLFSLFFRLDLILCSNNDFCNLINLVLSNISFNSLSEIDPFLKLPSKLYFLIILINDLSVNSLYIFYFYFCRG